MVSFTLLAVKASGITSPSQAPQAEARKTMPTFARAGRASDAFGPQQVRGPDRVCGLGVASRTLRLGGAWHAVGGDPAVTSPEAKVETRENPALQAIRHVLRRLNRRLAAGLQDGKPKIPRTRRRGIVLPEFHATGCVIHYLDEGTGRPVVFIHGFTCTSRFFERQRSFFGRRYRFIAPDLRSHGRSEKTHTGNTVQIQTQDLHELFTELDLRDAVLVGWSNGSFNIWQYLHDYGSERIAAIAVIDASPCPLNRDDWSLGYFELASLVAVMEARQTDNDAFVHEVFMRRIFAKFPDPADAAWMADEILMMPPTHAVAVGFQAMARDYRPLVPLVIVPALVCFGARSFVRIENARYLAEAMANARLVVFPGSGHSPFWEEADRFNHEVSTFIKALDATG
jgi:non-heme chloroperoxidase